MIKMTEAVVWKKRKLEIFLIRHFCLNVPRKINVSKDLTYDCKDEGVGEVSVKGELNHVSPKTQKLHGLCQAYEYVAQCQGQNR